MGVSLYVGVPPAVALLALDARSAELTSLHRVGAPDRQLEVPLGEAGLGCVL